MPAADFWLGLAGGVLIGAVGLLWVVYLALEHVEKRRKR